MNRCLKRTLAVVLLIVGGSVASPVKYSLVHDTLGPCNYTLLVPAKWNGSLLMIAHGLRPESAPLNSDIDTANTFPARLAKEGWLVAKSSFRKNGYVVKVAIDDIQELYGFIAKKYGVAKKAYLVGSSMGGAIGTVMAENPAHPYAGYLLMCPDCCDPSYDSIKITQVPQKPMLLVPNRDESGPPRQYAQRSKNIRPFVWIVNRDGHCQTTEEETYQAFMAMKKYADGGKIYDDVRFEIPEPWPKYTVEKLNDTLKCQVARIFPYGNMLLGLTEEHMLSIGGKNGDSLIIQVGDTAVSAVLGTKYNNAKEGKFVLFPKYYEGMFLAINFGNASEVLKAKAGVAAKIWRKYK